MTRIKQKPFHRVYYRTEERGKWSKWLLLATFLYLDDAKTFVRGEENIDPTDLQYIEHKIMYRNRNIKH